MGNAFHYPVFFSASLCDSPSFSRQIAPTGLIFVAFVLGFISNVYQPSAGIFKIVTLPLWVLVELFFKVILTSES